MLEVHYRFARCGAQNDALFHGPGEASAVRCGGRHVVAWTIRSCRVGSGFCGLEWLHKDIWMAGRAEEGLQELNLEAVRPGSERQSQDARRLQG